MISQSWRDNKRIFFRKHDAAVLLLLSYLYPRALSVHLCTYVSLTYFNHTIKRQIKDKLSAKPQISDFPFHIKLYNGKLIELTVHYVDDGPNAGTPELERLIDATLNHIIYKDLWYSYFGFLGTNKQTLEHDGLNLSQDHYFKWLSKIANTTDMILFRRSQALPAWIMYSKPKLAWLGNKSVQVIETTLNQGNIRALNKEIMYAFIKS